MAVSSSSPFFCPRLVTSKYPSCLPFFLLTSQVAFIYPSSCRHLIYTQTNSFHQSLSQTFIQSQPDVIHPNFRALSLS
ncbi:hypothetical protein HanXRQr2_Chr01g0023101 [Helianthus annuus]|uniref:Uncharacterized protein n=1 Tax=Helianthus annuus TaxID=4232 RepID=A0A251VP37_HELAN|nr:hypothetical protein HanXRQr2_Chr01g0023101 [Helianthus annuus]KAJ0957015.1 hypothetical protein HanPSC8_Chr01g0022301 [Helianthus annuus]